MIGEGNIFNSLGFETTSPQTDASRPQAAQWRTVEHYDTDSTAQQVPVITMSLTPTNIFAIVIVIVFAVMLFRIYALEREIKHILLMQGVLLQSTSVKT